MRCGDVKMSEKEKVPVKIEILPKHVAEGLLMFVKIMANKESLEEIPAERVKSIAFATIKEAAIAVVQLLGDEEHSDKLLDEFIKKSNLKYLERKPKLH